MKVKIKQTMKVKMKIKFEGFKLEIVKSVNQIFSTRLVQKLKA